MTIPEHCRLERRDPIISVKTPRAESRFILRNPARLAVTQLELEQFFPKGALNCDFVFQVPDKPFEIYVELKGSDFKHALDQLAASIAQLRSTLQPKCMVPEDGGVALGSAFKANLWEKYRTAAPVPRRQLGTLSSKVQKAYKS